MLVAVSRANGARGGIIDALEMEESDFVANLVRVETQETDVAAEYEKITQENNAMKTSKKSSDVKHKDYCIDELTRVKKTIDGMIAQLREKKMDEINHKDFCADDLNINQLETEKKDRAKLGLKAKN